MNLREDFEKLASRLAQRATQDDTSIEEATDALKAVTAFYAVMLKPKKSTDAEEPNEGFNFARGFNEEHENGQTTVRGRRGSA